MKITIIKFSAEWCGPCKTMAPIFEKISQSDDFKDAFAFKTLDIEDDDAQDLMVQLSIRSVPTIVALDENNNLLRKLIGLVNEDTLKTFLQDVSKENQN